MKVKFIQSCAGIDFAFAAQRSYELEDTYALGFVKAGLAVPVAEEPVAAVAPDVERVAVLPSPRKGRR